MVQAGIKDEFDAYVRNAELEGFVRRFKLTSSRNSHNVLFDLYNKSYTMDLEDFNTACKLPQWGSASEPSKSEFKDFLASITMGESREITQATIGSIHFPAIHYFSLSL